MGQKNGTIGPMQKLSETAGFARLMEISRLQLLRSNSGQPTPAGEGQSASVLDAVDGTEHAGNEKQDGQKPRLRVLVGTHSDLREVGPLLLPIVRAQILAANESWEREFQLDAVPRRKRLQIVRPKPNTATVFISKDASYLGVVVAGQLKHLAVCVDWFHPVSLITLDPDVKPYLTHV